MKREERSSKGRPLQNYINLARDYIMCDTNSRIPMNNKIQWSVEA